MALIVGDNPLVSPPVNAQRAFAPVRTLNAHNVARVSNAEAVDFAFEIVHEGQQCRTKVGQTGARHLVPHHVLGRLTVVHTVRGSPIDVPHLTDDTFMKVTRQHREEHGAHVMCAG